MSDTRSSHHQHHRSRAIWGDRRTSFCLLYHHAKPQNASRHVPLEPSTIARMTPIDRSAHAHTHIHATSHVSTSCDLTWSTRGALPDEGPSSGINGGYPHAENGAVAGPVLGTHRQAVTPNLYAHITRQNGVMHAILYHACVAATIAYHTYGVMGLLPNTIADAGTLKGIEAGSDP